MSLSSAFGDRYATAAERRLLGKARRSVVPRSSHAAFDPPASRPDPVSLLRQVNETRISDLVAVRIARMAASPFAFYRGSALQMARDLATTPASGAEVMLCGDAHIANFGVFASPERRLMFDLNDFDEVAPGPFEWDVKRLAASVVLAGRHIGMAEPAIYDVVLNAVDGYVHWINQFSSTPALDMFYAHLDSDTLLTAARGRYRAEAQAVLDKASGRDHHKALRRFVVERDGAWQIAADPPLIVRIDGPEVEAMIDDALAGYAETLSFERRALFGRFRFVDFARKVVGVGSVGTRCWIVLLRGWNGDPLFLQVKEAGAAAPSVALDRPSTGHEGQRVVDGQRALQSVSDILLGWTSDPRDGACYYVRQLWDDKGSVDLELITPRILRPYSRMCAGTLARAHARTGDAAFIAGYVGTSDRFARAVADFAVAYADQAERDHARLLTAIADGTLALSAPV